MRRAAARLSCWRGVGLCLLAALCNALPAANATATGQTGAEALYASASDLIAREQYTDALTKLRHLQAQYPNFDRVSAVQTRIAVLHETRDAGNAMQPFLQALNLRDSGHVDDAIEELTAITEEHGSSSLHDDALYLSAYVQIMDRYDYAAARTTLTLLHERFPDSAYRDSADYLEAIAREQLGDTIGAREALVTLRERHTALELPLGFRWPVGNVLSRYWFDRANRRLAILDDRLDAASTVSRRQRNAHGVLRLSVNVEGIDMELMLTPSSVTRETGWHNGRLQDLLPPAIGVYSGEVDGVAGSWVRAVLNNDSISGVVSANGKLHRLQPGNLIGTLDYYQPQRRRDTEQTALEQLLQFDMLPPPPAEPVSDSQRRAREIQTNLRVVPMSIVVDNQFDRYYGGAGLATALNQMNVADGIYRQFGLALSLDEAVVFTDAETDPLNLGPTTLESILRNFRDYRLQQRTFFSDSALAYLFSGNPKTDPTLGLAWIDTACRSDGYDVGVTTPGNIGDLLLTHEVGHSLGAPHDTDTTCNTDSGKLMWPNISSNTAPEFSSCSETHVRAARGKFCLLNAVDLALSVSTIGNTIEFLITNPDSALNLDARLVVETGLPDQLQWPAGCRVLTPTSAECALDNLRAGEQRRLSIPQPVDSAGQPVTGHLAPIAVRDIALANNVASLGIVSGDEVAGGAAGDHLPLSTADRDSLSNKGAKKSSAGALGLLLMTGLGLVLVTRRWLTR